MTLDFSQSWRRVRQPITVTLVKPPGRISPQETTLVPFVQEAPAKAEDVVKYEFTLVGTWKWFHLWVANLNGFAPNVGWKIIDNVGDTYEIKVRDLHSRRHRYSCLTLKVN